MTSYPDATHRETVYRRLLARNRLVAGLRLVVPALGVVALAVLVGQIYLSSLANRFGIEEIAISPDRMSVEAPEYAGVLDDGSRYSVSADEARAGLTTSSVIELNQTILRVTRPTGVTIDATAPTAELDTTSQLVRIAGATSIADTSGTTGTLNGSVFDWSRQVLTSDGGVDIEYADGTQIKADTMVYDARTALWTFTRVIVTLPATPGADPT